MRAYDGFTLFEDLEDYERRYEDAIASETEAKVHKFDYEKCLVWWNGVKDKITVSIGVKHEELAQAWQPLSRNQKGNVHEIIKSYLDRRKLW